MRYLAQIVGLAAMAIAGFVVFGLWPEIDLAIAAVFYDGSWLGKSEPFATLREIYYYGAYLVFFWIILLLIYSKFRETKISSRLYGFIVSLGLLGPLVFVNAILKEFWGRARPYMVEEFGGDRFFTPAQIFPVDQCQSNCSFVSGEASSAAVLILIGLLIFGASPMRRGVVILLILPMAGMRIMAGMHFASDVYFSFIFMGMIYFILLDVMRINDEDRAISSEAFWRDSKSLLTIFFPKKTS